MVVEGGQVKMDPVKVEGIAKWPTPTSVKELRAFLGKFLQRLHWPLLPHFTTPPWSNKEKQKVGMDPTSRSCISIPQKQIYLLSDPQKCRSNQTIHTRYRCSRPCYWGHPHSGIWRWTTPSSILFRITQPSRTKLQHLWQRTAGNKGSY